MREREREVLKGLASASWAVSKDGIWEDPRTHIAGINGPAFGTVMSGFDAAKASSGESPTGVVVTGRPGSGKSHLVSAVRSKSIAAGGYFFALDLRHERQFWPKLTEDVLSCLLRPLKNGPTQAETLRSRLSRALDLPEPLHRQLVGPDRITRSGLDGIVDALGDKDPQLAFECGHTLRALVLLLATRSVAARELARAYLTSEEEQVTGERAEWGMRARSRSAHETVGELFKLIALTGPSVIALDQIDTLVQQSDRPTGSAAPEVQHETAVGSADSDSLESLRMKKFEEVGSGLMELREVTRRSLVLVACMDSVWEGIERHALGSVAQRFRRAQQLKFLPSPEIALTLIERRFALAFGQLNFTPPYASWPIHPDAFRDAVHFTARGLIRRVDDHLQECLNSDQVTELMSLAAPAAEQIPERTPGQPSSGDETAFAAMDRKLADLMQNDAALVANVAEAFDAKREDERMPQLMRSALTSWVEEQGEARTQYRVPHETMAAGNPALHGELHHIVDEDTEDRIDRSFRAIAWSNGNAVIKRVKRVLNYTGLDPEVSKRKAYLLRTGDWSSGPKTRQMVQEFTDAGGIVIDLPRVDIETDLRTFAALERLSATEPSDEFRTWLLNRKPAGRTGILRRVFGDPRDDGGVRAPEPGPPAPAQSGDRSTPVAGHVASAQVVVGETIPAQATSGDAATGESSSGEDVENRPPSDMNGEHHPSSDPVMLDIGTVMDTGAPVSIALESLRKHTAIFAGSGSGKTVLIRRLVEECALRGVSAIVLDPNNDLARLGDAWPQPPNGWGPHDTERAEDYLSNTDVVVWTPRREAGRPLTFHPLPDFSAVVDDPDEFLQAIDTAVDALAPRARVNGSTVKADLHRAVLKEALRHFARRTRGGLGAFLDMLGDLPDGVTKLANARQMAADMAQTLRAAMINDPMFGESGEPVDPGMLLNPPEGRRARISVISLVGLPTEEQRQSFVNQLQMALFAWIKRNPAGDRPLGGLLVMDEAQTIAPSGALTASTSSTLALASQARKYGLGLVFATQAPRGIHNRIAGNAATQFFGFLNSPAQIAAVKEMAAAKGSVVPDISRLRAGQFYSVAEGLTFQRIRTPNCLSHHPPSPLTVEEVVERARQD
ncbi:ATP-binding protein [Myceligenerans pegani]|uniref:DUF87 domain-containing protein n=1 Tax=Myceligenerans pegani TaxID=2776917 RepID=A0ABR9N0J3_9MICO|nr:DUF87 domain-containing protein [Myceligenerans sp. TRM 65318]MBE1877170.1 DUF87 domain-containing protein [Myceligenerans sp. TRM 65318]MBE3019441.1 DUF87 domain-containing protein [Myceligenerans sp. TRM 65318]